MVDQVVDQVVRSGGRPGGPIRRSTRWSIRRSIRWSDQAVRRTRRDCHGVSFAGPLELARGAAAGYDIGKRNSTGVALPGGTAMRACDYPHCPARR